MDIDKISLQVLSDKPKPKFSYQLNLDINSDINQQFEIMSLIFLRSVDEKIIKLVKNMNDIKEYKKNILKQLFLIKLYLNSFGIDLKYKNLEKKECNKYKLNNFPNFYSKNKYNFNFCFLKNIYKKGKKVELMYNYINKSTSYNELFIVIKINNHYFKIELDLLKK